MIEIGFKSLDFDIQIRLVAFRATSNLPLSLSSLSYILYDFCSTNGLSFLDAVYHLLYFIIRKTIELKLNSVIRLQMLAKFKLLCVASLTESADVKAFVFLKA